MKLKSFIVIISTLVKAIKKKDFEQTNFLTSKCNFAATLRGVPCADAYKNTIKLINNREKDSEFKGLMEIQSKKDDWIISKKKTRWLMLPEDQLFEFEESNIGCNIACTSKSLLYGTNFCNCYNVISRLSGFTHYDMD